MATTPIYGWPYPVGTDRVMDGDNAIAALAQAIETTLSNVLGAMLPIVKRSTASLATTTVDQVVPGLTATITTAKAGYMVVIVGLDVVFTSGADVGFVDCRPFVDAAGLGGNIAAQQGSTAGGAGRLQLAGVWGLPWSAGTRTLDVRAKKSLAAGTANIGNNTSTMTALFVPGTGGAFLRDEVSALPAAPEAEA